LTTILVKNVPEGLLRQLKKLKADLDCKTWAELLAKLVESERTVSLSEEKMNEMRTGVRGFLKLRGPVTDKWILPPGVLEEVRKSRGHVSS